MSGNELCFCGSGRKLKKCHYTVKADSKLADIYLSYIRFDRAVRDNEIGAKCLDKCSLCCNDFFFVSENEFMLVLDWLIRNEGIRSVKKYIDKAIAYQQSLEYGFPEIIRELELYMPPMKLEDAGRYLDDNFNWNRSLSCIFLENGRCSIYDARPTICRKYGVCHECHIICNKKQHFEEEQQLYRSILIFGEENIVLSKRPYPLFYYFSHFLSENYNSLTMQKLLMIQTKNEKAYAEFTMRLSS